MRQYMVFSNAQIRACVANRKDKETIVVLTLKFWDCVDAIKDLEGYQESIAKHIRIYNDQIESRKLNYLR